MQNFFLFAIYFRKLKKKSSSSINNSLLLSIIIFLLMVRLEKIVYEQVVNSKTLGRARAIVTPAKWYVVNPHEQNKCN